MRVTPPRTVREVNAYETRSPCRECGASRRVGWVAARRARRGASLAEDAPRPARGAPRVGGVPDGGTGVPLPVAPVPIVAVDASTAAPRADRAFRSSIGCSTAASCPDRSRCSPASPAWARARCCSRRSGGWLRGGARCLLVTAEESCAQVRMRAERRRRARARAARRVRDLAARTCVAHVDVGARPTCLALDSIQTVLDPDLPGAPGSVTQVRDCAYRLVQQAKERELATVHRRPRHQGRHARRAPRARARRRHGALVRRRSRARRSACSTRSKHRFGSTHELGLFEMTRPRPRSTFPTRRRASSSTGATGVPGSAVAAVLEGTRPLLVEVQALVVARRRPAAPLRGRASMPAALAHAARGARAARRRAHSRRPRSTRASPAGSGSPRPGVDLARRARGRERVRRAAGRSTARSRSARARPRR